jgi:hypothetical protein
MTVLALEIREEGGTPEVRVVRLLEKEVVSQVRVDWLRFIVRFGPPLIEEKEIQRELAFIYFGMICGFSALPSPLHSPFSSRSSPTCHAFATFAFANVGVDFRLRHPLGC